VLFDLDGVLVDSRAIVERTWRRWAARHGIDPESVLRVAHGRRTGETLQQVAPRLATAEEVAWLAAAEMADEDGLVAVPGATRLLGALEGVPWAVVTSAGPELARRRLRGAGLKLPDVLVSSDDVTQGKPAPEGYLLAAERLAVSPSRAVVLEDTPPGIAAGRAAGMNVIGVATTYSAARLVGAAFVVADLSSVHLEKEGQRWRILSR
jgi:sugar-phosphatase